MTRNAPALLLADGTTYAAPRSPAPLSEFRVALPARPAPGPKHAAAEPGPAPAAAAEREAAAKRRWWWYLANTAIGGLVLTLMIALGAWSMWAMLQNVAGYLELHYPGQFARPATVPFWQGPAAAAVMAIDVGMVLWTVTDLWARILGREIGWLRLGARALGCTSIALNAFTGTDPITVLVHAGPAALYIGSIEAIAYLTTKRTAKPARRRGWVPLTQWLVEPGSARRMTFEMLTERVGYGEALARRGRRRAARAAFVQAFGDGWRAQVPLPVADAYRRGAIDPVDPVRLVVEARRMHAELSRELSRLESVTQVERAAREPRSEPRSEPTRRTNEPRNESPREPVNEPSGAHVIPFQTPLSSDDSPSEPHGEPRGGAAPARLTPGQGPRSEPNRDAINAVLAGRYESGEAAAKATTGASKATVNRWLGKLGWREDGTAV